MVYGIRYYGQGNLTEDNYVQFIKHDTLSSAYLNQSINFVPYIRKNFQKIKKVFDETNVIYRFLKICLWSGRFWVLDVAE